MRTLIIILISGVILVSCNLATHKHFTVYQNAPFDANSVALSINGVYFLKDYSKNGQYLPTLFFLFSDGSIFSKYDLKMSEVKEKDFWNSPKEYLRTMRVNVFSDDGHYLIRKDKIILQVFDINPGAIFPINSLEVRGFIKNDSTIILSEGFCNWCYKSHMNYPKNGRVEYGQVEYKLFKTDVRPDSSKMWFKEKKWYKRNVWYVNKRIKKN